MPFSQLQDGQALPQVLREQWPCSCPNPCPSSSSPLHGSTSHSGMPAWGPLKGQVLLDVPTITHVSVCLSKSHVCCCGAACHAGLCKAVEGCTHMCSKLGFLNLLVRWKAGGATVCVRRVCM